ncbi:hypothetical protein DRJ48_00140, partial [Candidatus Woesearchaeota archaeon]
MMEQPKGLFGKPKGGSLSGSAGTTPPIDASTLANLNRRMRMLEERVFNLQRKQQVTEENLVETTKDFGSEIKMLNQELAEVKSNFIDLRDRLE